MNVTLSRALKTGSHQSIKVLELHTESKVNASTVMFVIGSLAVGGAQRALARLANAFSYDGWQVIVLVLNKSSDRVVDMDSTVKIEAASNIRRCVAVHWLRHQIRKHDPDVLHSFNFETNILVTLAQFGRCRSKRIPVLWRLSSNYSRMLLERTPYNRMIFKALMSMLWRRADCVVAPSEDAAVDFASVFPGVKDRIRTIPNIVPVPLAPAPVAPTDYPLFISVGRLEHAKNFRFMLDAFAAVPKAYNAHLAILGDGTQRDSLIRHTIELGLRSRVHFPGHIDHPANYYGNATAYLLTSRREGFPNALAEAMAYGLPVVSVDCRSGPRELLQDGAFGHLVHENDREKFSAALVDVIENGGRDPRLGVERFSRKHVMTLYQDIVSDLLEISP